MYMIQAKQNGNLVDVIELSEEFLQEINCSIINYMESEYCAKLTGREGYDKLYFNNNFNEFVVTIY